MTTYDPEDQAERRRVGGDPDGVGPNFDTEIGTSGPAPVPSWTGNEKIDSHLALISEALQDIDQKKL